jgi:FMN phosphatase YigB (HAD superfamily)
MRSFDVFDTVLVRLLAEPRDVFPILGAELRAIGATGLAPAAFARARHLAQDRAAAVAPAGEATLEEIYRELGSALAWSQAASDEARAREITIEGRHLRGVPARRREIAALRANGESIIYLSDTQLPAAAIRGWLEREGLWAEGDRLFVSCEARASKRDGALFRAALRETATTPDAWLHTGDNPLADVSAPRRIGIQAVEQPLARLTRRERLLRGPGVDETGFRSSLVGAARLARLSAPAGDAVATIQWETAATVAGPLFLAFTAWVLDEAARRGVRRLYFVARGGQIFLRIAEEVRRAGWTDLDCRYLHLSRRALAGLGEWRQNRLREAITAPDEVVQTLARIQANLKLDETWPLPPGFAPADRQRPLSAAERSAVADWFLAPPQFDSLVKILTRHAELTRTYLAGEGLDGNEPVAFVDTGWAGTLQSSLENFLGRAGQPSAQTWFYLGLREGGSRRPNGAALGYFNAFRPLPLGPNPWLAALLELFARADHGTLREFAPAPILVPIDRSEIEAVRLGQAAILDVVRNYLTVGRSRPLPAADIAPVVIDVFADFAAHPDKGEALAWGRVPHVVHPADPGSKQLCPSLSLREIVSLFLHRSRRPPAWWLPGQAALGGGGGALVSLWVRLRQWRRQL